MASYELVLATDLVSNSVRRFDGNTGIPLGSFGAGQVSSPAGIYADGSTGLAYVGNFFGGISVFDYSTGEFVNSFAGTPSTIRGIRPCTAAGFAGQVFITAAGSAVRGTLTTTGFTSLATYAGVTLNGNGVVQLANGNVVAGDYGVLRIFSPTGTQLSVSTLLPGFNTATDYVGTVDMIGSTI